MMTRDLKAALLVGSTAIGLHLSTGTAKAFPVTVDDCGHALTFSAPPQRAVVHDLNMSEIAFSLGLQPSMVGVTGVTGYYKTTPEFREQQGSIPELAPKYPSLETLVAARPDFFFAGWYYGMKPGGDVTPDTLARHGITTYVLSESCSQVDKNRPAASLDLLYTDEMNLGIIFGKDAKAASIVSGWKSRVAAVQDKVKGKPPVRVFLYDSGEDKPFTAGKFAMPTALINAAGGTNVMADLPISWGTTSWEDTALKDPEFLILLDYQDGSGYKKLLDFLKTHPAMRETSAVRNMRFLPLRYEQLTPGPANIDAIEALAKALYPAAFATP